MTISSVLLQTICPALLPPADAVDFEYYAVLGLPKPKKTVLLLRNNNNNNTSWATPNGSDKKNKSKSKSSSSPTVTEIRKAYKLASLQLHPDKVAQRNDGKMNATAEAAVAYERVQEAAAVLQDDVQRQLYHDYSCSVARYRFVSSNSSASWPPHPTAVLDNLAAATWADKTRLLLLTTTVMLLVLMQPILVATKINHENQSLSDSLEPPPPQPALSTVPWTIILIPTWMAWALYVLGTGFVALVWAPRAWREHKHAAVSLVTCDPPLVPLLAWCEGVVAGIGCIVLARAWDDDDDEDKQDNTTTNWWTVLALPWYVVLGLRLARHVYQVHIWRRAMTCMHSVEYIQRVEQISAADWSHVYQPQANDDDDDDDANDDDADKDDEEQQQDDAKTTDNQYRAQREKVVSTYIVVHANPALVAHILEAIRTSDETHAATVVESNSDDMEAIRVQSSLEFQTIDRALQAAFRSMGILGLIWIPLVTLIVLKVKGTMDASWWVVFLPLWIRLGLPWIRHFLMCCCSGDGGELDDHDENQEKQKDDTKNENGDETKKDDNETKDTLEQADAPFTNATTANADMNGNEDTKANGPSPLRQLHKQTDVPDDEALWASSEGDMTEFNTASPKATTMRSSSSSTDANGVAFPPDSKPKPNDQDEKAAAKPQPSSGDDKNDDDGPDEDFEEKFRQYQQHLHQDDENERMQEKLNAMSSCCLLSFQLLLLCLVVAKLEHDSDVDNTGFNAFWVLFPILVLAGLVLLCCSTCIYAKNPPTDPVSAPSAPDESTSPPITEVPTVVNPATITLPTPTDASTTTTTPIVVAPTLVPDVTVPTAENHASANPTNVDSTVGPTTSNADAETGGGGTLEDLD
jgi:DnaJ domain